MMPTCMLETREGWFLGFDHGENGGSLWWFSKDGETTKKLSDDNARVIVKTKSGILVFSGIFHLAPFKGKILRIVQGKNGWETRLIVDMKSTPASYSKVNADTYLVATYRNLYRVNGSGKYEVLLSKNTELPYSNSIVEFASGKIALGMQHYVLILSRENGIYKQYWFSPADCQHFTDENPASGYKCKCMNN